MCLTYYFNRGKFAESSLAQQGDYVEKVLIHKAHTHTLTGLLVDYYYYMTLLLFARSR